jgi:acetyl-CoA synthetase
MNGTGCMVNNYEQTVRNFSVDVPEYFNFGFDIIDTWAK